MFPLFLNLLVRVERRMGANDLRLAGLSETLK